MKRLLFSILLLVSVAAQAQLDLKKFGIEKPSTPVLVNDFTSTLTSEQRKTLEDSLVAYDNRSSNQIAVVIIKSLNDYPIEDISLAILRQWGVGNTTKNNGIVVLVAKDDHKVRIEVGSGLEGPIPDMIAASIIDNEITPAFKAGDFYRGLDDGTQAIMKAASNEYTAPEGYGTRGNKKGIPSGAIIFIVIVIIIISSAAGGNNNGGYVSRRGYRGWWLPTSGGGWSGGGGGGGWSGGGGGGGFGGFGGGSGGGGGASGSW